MCHGDFPDGFLSVARHMALYQKCLLAIEGVRDPIYYHRPPEDDEFTRMGRSIASLLSSGLKPNYLELSYLGLKSPGVRQAVYRAASRGSGRIVCAGAAGLMIPCHGASVTLPYELKTIMRDNPALDMTLVPAALDAGEIAALLRRSLAYAFTGRSDAGKGSGGGCGSLEDTGVVLICSPDYGLVNHGSPVAIEALASASATMSDMSRATYMHGGRSRAADIMCSAASLLKGKGFHAAEAGFIDFALPDLKEAACRLIERGATHIVATGMPSLLHRHPYSIAGPTTAIERLRKALPNVNIVYVKPDPAAISESVAEKLMTGVLDAERGGTSLRSMLREL